MPPRAPRAAKPKGAKAAPKAPQTVIVLTPSPPGSSEPPRAVMVPVEVQAKPRARPPKVDSDKPKAKKRRPLKKKRATPEPLSRGWRVLSGAAAALFLVSAILQHDDPDGWAWAAMYAAPCAIGAWVAAGRRLRWVVPGVVCAVAALWALATVPEVARRGELGDLAAPMRADNSAEILRELGGLVLVAAYTGALARHLLPPRAPSKKRKARARFKPHG